MRVLHLISPEGALEVERGLGALMARIPRERAEQVVATLGGEVANRLARDGIAARRLTGPRPSHLVSVPAVRDLLRRERIELVQAWDVSAAMAARVAVGTAVPVVLSTDDPRVADRVGRWWRSAGDDARIAAVCSTEIVRRRLTERGVEPERTVVIRPPVDFGLINRVNRDAVRAKLGLGDASPVLLTPGPAAVGGGQREAIWAIAVLEQLWPNIRVLLPGRSREQERMRRFVGSFKLPQTLICTADRHPLWELLACADVCVTGAQGDVTTTTLSWAMAAGVPIVAPAVHAVTELIADRHNGLLCKQGLPRLLAARLIDVLDDRELGRRVAETARGQAYEVFGLRRFVDQHMQLYDNAVAGRPVATGIADSALVT